MQIELFHIPVTDNGEALSEMNRFLASHKVLEIEQHFSSHHQSTSWFFCVRYLPAQKENNVFSSASSRAKTDYKQILNETEFLVFSRLRVCRKMIAANDAVPAYAVFTDEELACITRLGELTLQTIQSVKGIGEKKMEKYGKQIIGMYYQNQPESSK